MLSSYVQKKLFAVAMVLLIVGGLNLGIMALTGKDFLTVMMGRGTLIANSLFFAIGIAALGIAFFRDSYLPFLGPSVVPCSLLAPSTPEGADYEVRVRVKPGQKVMYWAAEPETKDLEQIPDWRKAYLGFRNAGVTIAGTDGYATLKVRKPQPYQVPMRKALSPHIHYRICLEDGMVSRIETVTLDGKEYFENVSDYEGFANEEEEENEKEEGEEGEEEETIAEEGFRAPMPPGEEEGFVSSMFKGEHEKVPPSSFDIVEPKTAQEEIDAVINDTARRSLMAEVSAMDESPNKYVDLLANAEFQ
jgi:uncharacterized membrane protein YuzA (DUF378 family)